MFVPCIICMQITTKLPPQQKQSFSFIFTFYSKFSTFLFIGRVQYLGGIFSLFIHNFQLHSLLAASNTWRHVFLFYSNFQPPSILAASNTWDANFHFLFKFFTSLIIGCVPNLGGIFSFFLFKFFNLAQYWSVQYFGGNFSFLLKNFTSLIIGRVHTGGKFSILYSNFQFPRDKPRPIL